MSDVLLCPAEILQSRDLDPSEKLVMIAICDRELKDGACLITNEQISSAVNIGTRQVQRILIRLMDKQYIAQASKSSKINKQFIVLQRSSRSVEKDLQVRVQTLRRVYKNNNNKLLLQKESSNNMIGFNGDRTDKQNNYHPFDKLCAIELREVVQKQTMSRPGPIAKDLSAFRLLRTKDKISQERIDATLLWHCEHLRDKWEPKAFTGEDFRKKFLKIESALLRHHPPEEIVEISPQTIDIVSRLKMLGWKKVSMEKLAIEVELSLHFVRWLRSTLATMKSVEDHAIKSLYLTALLERLPRNWVEQWYEHLHKRLSNWEAWNGDLSSFRMSIESKDIVQKITGILTQYGGAPAARYIPGIMERLNENK